MSDVPHFKSVAQIVCSDGLHLRSGVHLF